MGLPCQANMKIEGSHPRDGVMRVVYMGHDLDNGISCGLQVE